MHLEELDVDVPICGHHPVAAIVHVVRKIVQDGLLRPPGHTSVSSPSLPEQLVDRAGRDCSQKLALGIGPRSVLPVCSSNGRGAISAISRCASIGAVSGNPAYFP